MPRINLLPWREELRQERQQQFIVGLAISAAAGGVAVFGVNYYYDSEIDFQNQRNNYLREEIRLVDEKIKEINELQQTKQRLLARMRVIEQLQKSRPEIVHLFDELVRTLPDGVYLTSIRQTGPKLELRGKAESSARVSAYMRNIDASDWIGDPALTVIETKDDGRVRRSDFTLQAQQVRAGEEGEEGETG